MIKKLFLFAFLFYGEEILSQSTWDIDYIKVDSISKKDIGKEVQIDFKNQKGKGEGKSFRYSLPREDTGILVIDKESLVMREVRKVHPDWGLYKEQYLESLNEVKTDTRLRIINSVLKEVNQDSILITASVEWRKIKKKKSDSVINATYDIWIEKNKLSGLICKTS